MVGDLRVAQPIHFAMIVNGSFSSSLGYEIEDNVAYAVATYAASLGELPSSPGPRPRPAQSPPGQG